MAGGLLTPVGPASSSRFVSAETLTPTALLSAIFEWSRADLPLASAAPFCVTTHRAPTGPPRRCPPLGWVSRYCRRPSSPSDLYLPPITLNTLQTQKERKRCVKLVYCFPFRPVLLTSSVVPSHSLVKMSNKIRAFELQSKCVEQEWNARHVLRLENANLVLLQLLTLSAHLELDLIVTIHTSFAGTITRICLRPHLYRNKTDLLKQLGELKTELLALRVQKIVGGSAAKLTKM